ncbi:MAG: SDR family oxidoreductase [Vicinamibacterales bacterium]
MAGVDEPDTFRSLTGRAALVTASRRLGRAVALGLARAGADVAVTFRRDESAARDLVEAIEAAGSRAVAFGADLSRADECRRVVDDAARTLGRLDILVNVASTFIVRPFASLTADALDADLAVDLLGAAHCAQAAVPHMRRAGQGRIVNLTDWVAASRRPRYRGYLGYYVAKSSVIALTEALALELAGDGILVNAVAPGPILPAEGTSEASRERVRQATPLGRWGGGDAVSRAVLVFVESAFITGDTIRVDGGRHLA